MVTTKAMLLMLLKSITTLESSLAKDHSLLDLHKQTKVMSLPILLAHSAQARIYHAMGRVIRNAQAHQPVMAGNTNFYAASKKHKDVTLN